MTKKSHQYSENFQKKEVTTEEKVDAINNSISSLVMAGCGVNLKFVVLPVLEDGKPMDDSFFVGLVNNHSVIPLCYTPTWKDGVESLDAIATGFLALGYRSGLARIIPEEH